MGPRFFLLLCCIFSLRADEHLISKIPLNLWQTYKTADLPLVVRNAQTTWTSLNPEFSYFFYEDADILHYIQQKWPPEFSQFFQTLPVGAMKADLWRYLIIASEGGVYTDIDSVCFLPIREWTFQEALSNPHVLLIDLDCNPAQFCQWTFAATPRHPAMLYICYYVLNQWKTKGFIRYPDGRLSVLSTTGPMVFSEAINSYIGEPLNKKASTILRQYNTDQSYRARLNRLGIFFPEKGFFNGIASNNLFWGTWSD